MEYLIFGAVLAVVVWLGYRWVRKQRGRHVESEIKRRDGK